MKGTKGLRAITLTALFAALLAVSALISVPLTVPVTLQTLVLFLAFFVTGGRISTLATLLYIAIGALGVPVFAGFTGGVSRLFDATGGYILGLLLASLTFWLLDQLIGATLRRRVISASFALCVLYASGTLWYSLVYLGGGADSTLAVLITCVLPFVIPDAIKMTVAYYVAKKLAPLHLG